MSASIEKTQPQNGNRKGFLGILKFESISIITIIFAVMVARGYVYLEQLNILFGVPTWRMGYSSLMYALYGGLPLASLFIAILVGTAAGFGVIFTIRLLEKPSEKVSETDYEIKQRTQKFDYAFPFFLGALVVGILSLVLWALLFFVSYGAQKSASKTAYEFISYCNESTLSLKNLDKLNGCIVGETDDMLYLVKRRTINGDSVDFDKIIQPKNLLFSSVTPKTIENPNN